MTEVNLLSIDWDYFILVYKYRSHSYRETMQDIKAKWYKEYLLGMESQYDIKEDFSLGPIYNEFLTKELPQLKFLPGCNLTLSESHAQAYIEAQRIHADTVYLIDAHSDLGYGGLEALDYEVNCANWLGKLLKEGSIKRAFIVYSPYTKEYPEEFEEIIKAYDIQFISLQTLIDQHVSFKEVHICRSGPWTPPWYDDEFYKLARAFNLPMIDLVGGKRQWHPNTLSLAERINYCLGVI